MIGDAITRIRNDKNIRQNVLASNLKMSVSYLSEIESNNRKCSLKKLKEIAIELDCDLGYLVFQSLKRDDRESKIIEFTSNQEWINKMIENLL